ncbi:hypothetical protein VP01_1560g2 [Puccinia sorghi]|uniref:Uncharacterized protein n=1 Tax=Puccinia sorghi TaxID=27349 RepID=A0A0L6VI63_9BASI|nr:hypothetical protein VP01_1560g2 [Puccinia sorghi]
MAYFLGYDAPTANPSQPITTVSLPLSVCLLPAIYPHKNYAAKFMVIEKYFLTNEHISSVKDVIYIFLSAFPCETCIHIKRELISNNKIKFYADGCCKPQALSDLLDFTEKEIKAASDDNVGYGRAIVESNRVIQQGIEVNKRTMARSDLRQMR